MIHQYQNNGYNIVLDVNSGAVHVVDQEAYDVIEVLNRMNEDHTDIEISGNSRSIEKRAWREIF